MNNEITLSIGDAGLSGNLVIPDGSQALVIFSHGSGSSRFSPRNRYVAQLLNGRKIATLLTDLLTEEEDKVYDNRFDIGLITERLVAVTKHVRTYPGIPGLKLGYFGASTGAASALRAASQLGSEIAAVVSRGGRPDLAREELKNVKSPTLLLVGSLDGSVITLNQKAYNELRCIKQLTIIEGAGHLFEEPGKLEVVAEIAASWFARHFGGSSFNQTKN